MPTCEENRARRRWASADPAARAATEALQEAIIRLSNHYYLSYDEKLAQLAQMQAQPQRLATQEAVLRQLVDARTKASVEQWGHRQRFSRAYAATGPDLSSPSHFNTRKEYTTR